MNAPAITAAMFSTEEIVDIIFSVMRERFSQEILSKAFIYPGSNHYVEINYIVGEYIYTVHIKERDWFWDGKHHEQKLVIDGLKAKFGSVLA